jgi:hypothetical protein
VIEYSVYPADGEGNRGERQAHAMLAVKDARDVVTSLLGILRRDKRMHFESVTDGRYQLWANGVIVELGFTRHE